MATALGESRFDIEGRSVAARFRTERRRAAVVNSYFPEGNGRDRDGSWVGLKHDFYRVVSDRVQQLRCRCL